MQKPVFSLCVVGVMMLMLMSNAQAAALNDAKDLGIKAAAYVKKVGKNVAAKELNTPGNPFDKGELYVTLQDIKGVFIASPKEAGLAGQTHYNLKDSTGKLFVQEMIGIAESPSGSGWVTYTWKNPATAKVQSKKAWVQRVHGTDLYTLSGVFQ